MSMCCCMTLGRRWELLGRVWEWRSGLEEEVPVRGMEDGEMEDEGVEEGGRETGGLWRCEEDNGGHSNETIEFRE